MSKKDSSLGLAITSVGDLLLNKTITKNQENKEINSIDLVIPNYQRPIVTGKQIGRAHV